MSHDPSLILSTAATTEERLDRFLAQSFPDISRARFQRLIADGQVSVEGQVVLEARNKLKIGQTVVIHMPPAIAPEPLAETIPLTVVYEDHDVIVINKPAGLVVHPGAGNETGTLVNALIAHCGESLSGIGGVKRPGIVHRLDKDTSGLLVVAKNDSAHQGLSEQFSAHGRDGRLERSYTAIVWGYPERGNGTITTGIERSSSNRQKMAVSKRATAREAITHYEVLKSYPTDTPTSLLRCRLETGRTHQIRVHMTHSGHPLLGDHVYGGAFKSAVCKLSDSAQTALAQLNRQALHATTLGFEHPRTGKALFFEAAPPVEMQALMQALATPITKM